MNPIQAFDRFKRTFRAIEGHVMTHPEVVNQWFTSWLYSGWSEKKLRTYEFLDSGIIPFVKEYQNYLLDVRADEEYLQRYGMTYEDIHDPRKLKQTSSGSAMIGAGINFVSHNVERLYR